MLSSGTKSYQSHVSGNAAAYDHASSSLPGCTARKAILLPGEPAPAATCDIVRIQRLARDGSSRAGLLEFRTVQSLAGNRIY